MVGIDTGFSIYDQADRLRVVKSVMEIIGWEEAGWTPERVESAISRAKNELVSPRGHETPGNRRAKEGWLAQVYELYEARLKMTSAVDFDDLLVHMVAILKEHPDVRAELDRRFKYVLVDEYQDTNLAQYAIVRALSVEHPNLCVTGDPDQSIYGWRGANLSNILEFEHDFPGCRVVTLERNYRSTKNIISVADHLIRFNRNRKPKALKTENPVGDPVELTIYPRESDEAEGDRRQDRRAGPRGRVWICRYRRLLPRDRADSSARASLPRRQDSLSDRRRRGVLRTPGSQGRPRLPEPAGQSQGRPRLRAHRQRSRRAASARPRSST